MAEHSLGAGMAHSRNGHGAVSEEPFPASEQQQTNIDASAKNEDSSAPVVDIEKPTLRELLKRFLQTKDPCVWAQFQAEIARDIRGTIAKRLGRFKRDDLIDDLEHDTYLKLIANDYQVLRKEWPDDRSIFCYVKVSATNVEIDRLRRSSNKVFLNQEDVNVLAKLGTTDHEGPDRRTLLAEIEKCLQTWSHEKDFERDHAIFYFFHGWGYTAREIAEMPSINLSTKKVENILQKMTSRLRAKLRKPGRGATPE